MISCLARRGVLMNMSISEQTQKNWFNDPSLWLLLFSNIAAIFFAVKENWDISTILWVYWSQSIIIGFFNFIRLLQLKDFSTKGMTINGHPAEPTNCTKIFTAYFFLFHYGFFHLIYFIFLSGTFTDGNMSDSGQIRYILLTAFLFFANHLFSYVYNRQKEIQKSAPRPNIGAIMFFPYARIIPMHLTLLIGAAFGGALVIFLVLKTFADALMHIVEHNLLRKEQGQTHTSGISGANK